MPDAQPTVPLVLTYYHATNALVKNITTGNFHLPTLTTYKLATFKFSLSGIFAVSART